MIVVAATAAVGASACWAGSAMLAHLPAKRLGAFELTRTQLVASSAILVLAVSLRDEWASVRPETWQLFLASSFLGVLVGNPALTACLRRAGPRRAQLLLSLNSPISAVLGFLFLGEVPSPPRLVGAVLVLCGIWLAIGFGGGAGDEPDTARVELAASALLGLTAATCQASCSPGRDRSRFPRCGPPAPRP